MKSSSRRLAWLGTFALMAVTLAACSPQDDADSGAAATTNPAGSTATPATGSAPASPAATCTPTTMKTLKSATITFGTDKPVYEPWFVDDDPTNGKGFESAVAYAVAKQLGYDASAVKWTRVSFNAAIAPGPKKFDADINEFSITAQRRKAVDFSTGYFDVAQAVVTVKGGKAASAASLADLKSLKLGAQVGTTSYSAITDIIKPNQKPAVFNNNDDAKAALKNGQIDGLVADLPTAIYISEVQLSNGKIAGQLPPPAAGPEQFGLVLDKGSSLTSCFSKAIAAVRADGTLGRLVKKWVPQAGVPELS